MDVLCNATVISVWRPARAGLGGLLAGPSGKAISQIGSSAPSESGSARYTSRQGRVLRPAAGYNDGL